MINRSGNGQFVKGKSGNPGGRPKAIENIRELARNHTEEAIKTLVEISNNPKSSDSARVQAANALLDRAWGKPTQYNDNLNQNFENRETELSLAIEERMEQLASDNHAEQIKNARERVKDIKLKGYESNSSGSVTISK